MSDAARTCCIRSAAAVVVLRCGGSGARGGALVEETRTFSRGRKVEGAAGRCAFVGETAGSASIGGVRVRARASMLGRALTMCMLGRASLMEAWTTEGQAERRDCLAVGRTVSMIGKGVIGAAGRGRLSFMFAICPTMGRRVVGLEGRGRPSLVMGTGTLRVSDEGIVSMSWRISSSSERPVPRGAAQT